MSDQYPPPPSEPTGPAGSAPPPPPAPQWGDTTGAPPAPTYAAAPPVAGQMGGQMGPIGQVRSTGMAFLLFIVTFGIYGWYYWYKVHEEMKQHSGQGIGGAVALILAIFVGIVMPYLTSAEVGGLYKRRGQKEPVSGVTGLWYFPGMFILVGPIIWFVKTNGALNDYWKSLGAQG
ncbi:MAG: DUF4234 domain-containing protein [Actinomycetota bacterium]|nr:DUF4234 domain-containing protein [Actinomycetota bacterium]